MQFTQDTRILTVLNYNRICTLELQLCLPVTYMLHWSLYHYHCVLSSFQCGNITSYNNHNSHIEGGTKLKVCENRVLRRIFGPRRNEVKGKWRKLHNEKLNDLYSSPNIVRVIKSRRMRWAGHIARMGERRGVCRVLVGKPEGKRPLGRPRRRWEGNMKIALQEVRTWGYGLD